MAAKQKLNLVVARAADEFAPCVDYVFGTLAWLYGWNIDYAEPAGAEARLASLPQPRVALIYGSAKADETGPQRVPQSADFALSIRRSDFFGANFLKKPDMPVAAEVLLKLATHSGFHSRCHATEKSLYLSVDVVAAAFWFLSRYEEYVTTARDEHGRFQCAHSIAPTAMYDQPLVNRWFEEIAGVILTAIGAPQPKLPLAGKSTVCLTHDVDVMRKYRGMRGVKRALSNMVTAKGAAGNEESRRAAMVLAGVQRDPYDSFDDLFTLKEKIRAPSTFFLMGGGKAPLDGDYKLDDPQLRELLIRIRGMNDEVGVHPSYESFTSEKIISAEKQAVQKAFGEDVQGTRQHYLRFKAPETWRAAAAAKLRYDSSMGFADRAGFRCGWSGCFYPFDVIAREKLPIIEVPIVLMDVTLPNYEKVTSEHALERLASLLDASAARGGAFVLLWHNILRDGSAFPGYWDTLEYFLFAAAGSVRFVTLSRLCDEFEAQRFA